MFRPGSRRLPQFRPRPGSLLRQPNFVNLLASQTVSQLGNQVSALALPLLAIIVVKASPFQVALVGAVQLLPFLLLSLPAGVWVDRLPRRTILIVCDVGSALLVLSIPAAQAAGMLTLAHLYGVGFLKGVCSVFADVARQAYLPTIVERGRLLEGNARMEIGRSGAQVTGPGLAGGLVSAMSASTAVLADVVSFFGSAIFLYRIRTVEPPARRAEAQPPLRSEIGEGLRYVFSQRLLRPILMTAAASNLLLGMSGAVHLLFLVRELHLSAGVLGMVLAVGNGGFVLGAALATKIPRRLGVGKTICLAAGASSVPLLLLASTPAGVRAIPLLVAGGLVGSFGSVVYGINQVSLRQAVTPERLHGRMNATMKFLVMGFTPVGAVIGGVLGEAIGLRGTIWLAAAGACLAALPVSLSPLRKVREMPQESDPDPLTLRPPRLLHPGGAEWVFRPAPVCLRSATDWVGLPATISGSAGSSGDRAAAF
ncbi:MAG: MFS transporter [Actinomycetota bacterium]